MEIHKIALGYPLFFAGKTFLCRLSKGVYGMPR